MQFTVHVETNSRISLVLPPAEEVVVPVVVSWLSQLPNPVTVVSLGYSSVAPLEVTGPLRQRSSN